MSWTFASKFVAYSTCVFLTPFCLVAYFDPMSTLSLSSIGLEPSQAEFITGLSNIRGSIGGLRLGIIAMLVLGARFRRRDLCLSAAILVGAVSAGRFISLGVDGWQLLSFITASWEVLISVSMLHLGGFLPAGSSRQ